MLSVVQHEVHGQIIYEENFWTGKKTVSIGGIPLKKQKKNVYLYENGEAASYVTIQGNFATGVKLLISGEAIELTKAAKWYEIALSVSIFALIMVWGNVEALFTILPVVGGAIGGGISGAAAIGCLIGMKSTKSLVLKLLIWLGCMVATLVVCGTIGFGLIAVLT